MKKLLFLSLILIFFNCENETSNNIPAFEARINDNFDWVADSYSVTLQNNQLSLTGNSPFGTIALQIDSLEVGSYNLYSWTDDFAVFQDTLQYSTRNDGITSIAFLSDGHVDINEIDSVNNTVSGHFHFDAYNGTGEYTINISEGVFYKIPMNLGSQD